MATQLQVDIINSFGGYTVNLSNGQYVWTGTPASAGIIAAVEALPSTANTVYSLTESHDDAAVYIALKALLTIKQQESFDRWLYSKYCTACNTALLADSTLFWEMCKNILTSQTLESTMVSCQASLATSNLTRSVDNGGVA